MKPSVLDRLAQGRLFFDGALGSEIEKLGEEILQGKSPEALSCDRPAEMRALHGRYLAAGCDVLSANTFGANPFKADRLGYPLEKIIEAALQNARAAIEEAGAQDRCYVALDVGPSGKLMQPFGEVSFDEMYAHYCEVVKLGERFGADLILFETFADVYELKAAVLAAKEHTALPVFASMTLEKNLHTLTGSDIPVIATMLESLPIDAIGLNCSLGPAQMQEPIAQLLQQTTLPVLLQPNAGLPEMENGKPVYRVGPEEFAEELAKAASRGVRIFGGCCGTTPAHIQRAKAAVDAVPLPQDAQTKTHDEIRICSYQQYRSCTALEELSLFPILLGQNGNSPDEDGVPLSDLADGDFSTAVDLAFDAMDDEADAIVLVAVEPLIKPETTMAGLLRELSAVTRLPILLKGGDEETARAYARYVNGKAVVL